MYVRYLNGRAKDQQQGTEKRQHKCPTRPAVMSWLHSRHLLNYNVPPAHRVLGECLRDSLFPSSLGLQDKFHNLPG
jgi:hypothetical protein